ncbi:MAG: formimidoylglutamate deiminase [Acidobacteriaceae bacterium]|nr:formimidoylglutamate deiminase [Acidobacteriaceae bacterium]
MPETENGWLPDLLYRDGKFESGVALFAGANGRTTRFSREPEDLRKAERLSGRALLPGLVSAHSHSFQRAIRGRTERRTAAGRDSFWTWREAMYHTANRLSPDDVYAVARMAFLEMALSGITTVGEFHYLHHSPDGTRYEDPNLLAKYVVQAANDVGVRIVLLRTAYARAGWQMAPNPGQARFITPSADTFLSDTEELRQWAKGRASVGVAPHSVRAVPLEYFMRVVEYATAQRMPIHMHAAEQPAEIDACLNEHGVRPIELLQRHGLLGPLFTAIHAIHVTEEEIGFLAQAGARVCACPTTERNLGDGAVPADKYREHGVPICLGSDSNVQIDLLEDARELEYHLRMKKLERAVLACGTEPENLAHSLFESATRVGAASLQAGHEADFFTVDSNDPAIAGASEDSLLSHIVFSAGRSAIRDTYVAGKAIVQDGRHAQQAEITEEFRTVQRKLWS